MRALSIAVFVALTAGSQTADATETIEERPSMRISLAQGHAKLVVQRTWRHDAPTGFFSTSFNVPEGGVVGGVKAQISQGWVHPKLMAADAAQERFDGTGAPGGDAFLLTGSRTRSFNLVIAAGSKSAKKSLTYTVLLPTDYTDGRHVLLNPAVSASGVKPTIASLRGAGKLFVDGVDAKLARRGGKEITGEALQLEHRTSKPLTGALAFVNLGKERRALRYRIHAAPKLSRAPRHAHVVLVLDGSRSMSKTQADGVVAAARAYLSHLRDAKVDIVVFDRFATSLFGKLVPAGQAETLLATLSLQRQNGSDVAAALTLASKRLEKAPRGSEKRIVLFTDALTKPTVDAADLGLDRATGLLHVALMKSFTYALTRDDLHAWAPHVAKTGGVVWDAPARPKADLSELAGDFEELVRPTRIHRVALRIPAAESLERVASTLVEGQGLSGLSLADDLDPRVRLSGVLWQKPVSLSLNPSPTETRLWESMLLGSEIADDLTDDEVRRLGLKAKIVTDQTSFVFATPGKREVMGGLGLIGIGSSCCGCRMTIGKAAATAFADPDAWLQKELSAAHTRCSGGDTPVTVTIDTTKDEIVDVSTQTANAKLSACMSNETWDLMLPRGFGARREAARFTVAIHGAD